jgi:hypothetical protein
MRSVTHTAVAFTSEIIRRDQGRGSGGRDDERTGTGIVRRPLDLDSVEKQYAFYSRFWCALMMKTTPRAARTRHAAMQNRQLSNSFFHFPARSASKKTKKIETKPPKTAGGGSNSRAKDNKGGSGAVGPWRLKSGGAAASSKS